MFKIHRPSIKNPEDAVRMEQFLEKIDSNSVNIASYAEILKQNREIIQKLLTINECNMIKSWLSETEGNLCFEGS